MLFNLITGVRWTLSSIGSPAVREGFFWTTAPAVNKRCSANCAADSGFYHREAVVDPCFTKIEDPAGGRVKDAVITSGFNSNSGLLESNPAFAAERGRGLHGQEDATRPGRHRPRNDPRAAAERGRQLSCAVPPPGAMPSRIAPRCLPCVSRADCGLQRRLRAAADVQDCRSADQLAQPLEQALAVIAVCAVGICMTRRCAAARLAGFRPPDKPNDLDQPRPPCAPKSCARTASPVASGFGQRPSAGQHRQSSIASGGRCWSAPAF